MPCCCCGYCIFLTILLRSVSYARCSPGNWPCCYFFLFSILFSVAKYQMWSFLPWKIIWSWWFNAAPPQAEIKYLTWHRSVSSQLSPSKNPPRTILVVHTSTLDRLYAWETKLYDEVKVIACYSMCTLWILVHVPRFCLPVAVPLPLPFEHNEICLDSYDLLLWVVTAFTGTLYCISCTKYLFMENNILFVNFLLL